MTSEHLSEAATDQGTPKVAGKPAEAGSKEGVSPAGCREARPCPHLGSGETINLCCLKPPSVWDFVTAALGNQCACFLFLPC